MTSVTEIYVYYRVKPGSEPQAQAAVNLGQQMLLALYPGIQGRLLKRLDAQLVLDNAQTWMEIYVFPLGHAAELPKKFLVSLEATMEQVHLTHHLMGPRRSEIFQPCA